MRNKRILSALTAALTAMSFSLSAAAETAESRISASAARNAEIASCLGYVESQKELWGIGDVNFEDLYLGEAVQTYEYLADGFSPCVSMYPLICGDDIVLWAIETGESYQITTELTYSISDYIDADTEFSIVYAADGSYLYTGGEFVLLSEYGGDSNREALCGDESGGGLTLSSISESEPLNYCGIEAHAANTLYDCDVDCIAQQYNNLCWAASCASILNYVCGTNYTAVSLAQSHFGSTVLDEFNQGIYPDEVSEILASYGGIAYTYKSVAPSALVVLKNIKADYPIYGGFRNANNTFSHGCVIYGINTSTETFFIMDPNNGGHLLI